MALAVLLTLAIAPPAVRSASAQDVDRVALLSHPDVRSSPVLERGGYLVVIDLDENLLHFLHGRTILWSAPVGTGMGLRLETEDGKWEFSTPTGEYQVKYKEENPVWVAPDWYFVENKLPVPPQNDPRRRFPGGLGVAAVHIGAGLAIHGTDKPDLLGQRISHGCIRLANEYAQRLYHNVQVGTKVLIIGTEDEEDRGHLIPGQVPGAGPVDARTQRVRDRAKADRERLVKQLEASSTEKLLDDLETALAERDAASAGKWPEIASVLVRRAVKDGDVDAAQGLLELEGSVRGRGPRAEYATFLADLYWRSSATVTQALAEMRPSFRRAAAATLVEAVLGLSAGGDEAATAPWPTRRVLRTALADTAQPGWDALHDAERAYRERRMGQEPRATRRSGI